MSIINEETSSAKVRSITQKKFASNMLQTESKQMCDGDEDLPDQDQLDIEENIDEYH